MLNTHIEEHSLNAWPGLTTYLYDGVVVRLADGYTKRANSATPLYAGRRPWGEKIAAVEGIYRQAGQPTIFRLVSFRPETEQVDALLNDQRYDHLDPTLVLALELSDSPLQSSGNAAPANPETVGVEAFLTRYHELQNAVIDPRHQKILRQAAGQPRCLLIQENGRPLAVGLGIFAGTTLGIFDIFTHPDRRRRGLGRAIVTALLNWGSDRGATTAYLQVMENNRPAIQLYQKLGFNPHYRYWYRRKASDG